MRLPVLVYISGWEAPGCTSTLSYVFPQNFLCLDVPFSCNGVMQVYQAVVRALSFKRYLSLSRSLLWTRISYVGVDGVSCRDNQWAVTWIKYFSTSIMVLLVLPSVFSLVITRFWFRLVTWKPTLPYGWQSWVNTKVRCLRGKKECFIHKPDCRPIQYLTLLEVVLFWISVRDTFCSYPVMDLCTKGLGQHIPTLKVTSLIHALIDHSLIGVYTYKCKPHHPHYPSGGIA